MPADGGRGGCMAKQERCLVHAVQAGLRVRLLHVCVWCVRAFGPWQNLGAPPPPPPPIGRQVWGSKAVLQVGVGCNVCAGPQWPYDG